MPRIPRVVIPGVAHHLTQGGIHHQEIFYCDADRRIYLNLIADAAEQFGLKLLGYCLMENHVHWVVVPAATHSLSRAFGWAHGRYSQYLNMAFRRRGQLWQNPFLSCALDEEHTWAAIRYVEMNPVRAGLVKRAEAWQWSSARARSGLEIVPTWLNVTISRSRFDADDPQKQSVKEATIRECTYTGRPAGSITFIESAEYMLARPLTSTRRRAKTLAATG